MQPLSEPTGEHDRLPLLLGTSALLLLLLPVQGTSNGPIAVSPSFPKNERKESDEHP